MDSRPISDTGSSEVSGALSPMAVKLQTCKKYYGFLVIFLVVLSALGSFVNDMETGACHRPNMSNTAVMIHRPVNLA